MTTDLDRLIGAVEAGTLDAYDCGRYGRFIAPYCNGETITLVTPLNAYYGDLNVAVTLLEALLPGWEWGRMNSRMFVEQGGSVVSARGSNPARALLLAVLRAKLMEASHE